MRKKTLKVAVPSLETNENSPSYEVVYFFERSRAERDLYQR